MGNNIVRARLYERVSTERQATEGFSLEAQNERLTAYCKSQGWEIAGTYVDDGQSAKTLDRPEFKRMIADCEEGDYILVYRLDRLTRSSKDIEFLLDLAETRRIFFKSATEDINTSTSSGRFHLRLIVQFAQYERESISERTVMGKKRRATSGIWQGGKAPFGYVLVDSNEVKNGRYLKRLEPDPLRSHLVPQIFQRYVNGSGIRQIARWLIEQGVSTATGAMWSAPAVSRILENSLYYGDVSYGRTLPNTEEIRTPSETFTPLISRELFEQAERIKTIRKKQPPRHATGMFPLTGVAVCGGCGTGLVGSNQVGRKRPDGSRYPRRRVYSCGSHRKGRPCGPNPIASVSADAIEEIVVTKLDELVHSTEAFTALFDEYVKQYESTVGDSAKEIDLLTAELNDVNAAIGRWDTKYERGNMEEDEHEEKTKPLRERARAIKQRLADIPEVPSMPSKESMQVVFSSVATSWAGLTHQERKALFQAFCDETRLQIVVYPGRRVEFRPRPLV